MKHHTQLTRPFSPAEEAEEAEMQAGRGAGSDPRGSGAEGGWPAGLAGRAARSLRLGSLRLARTVPSPVGSL